MTQDSVSQPRGTHALRTAFALMVLGLIAAIVGASVSYYLNSRVAPHRLALQSWGRNLVYLWPSGLMMMAAETSGPVMRAVILLISIIANGCIYGLVGLGIGVVWDRVRT